MLTYTINAFIFRFAYVATLIPGLSFRMWMPLMQIKLRAAKKMSKAKEVDYENIGC